MYEIQKQIEELTNKYQLMPTLEAWIDNYKDYDFVEYCEEKQVDYNTLRKAMIMIAIYKRLMPKVLMSMLVKRFDTPQGCADFLTMLIQDGFIGWDPATRMCIVVLEIPADLQDKLNKYQYPLPCVVPPKHVKENTDTGFYLTHGSILLNKSHHNQDVNLDFVNLANKTQFKLDHEIAHTVPNTWKNINKPKDGESKEEFKKRRRAFEKFNNDSLAVIDALVEHANGYVHLPVAYDKRGRHYVRGYHVNYQGNSWCKSVILFANTEIVQGV